MVEEWKWDIPVWCQGGIICTGETYKGKVKLTFAKGPADFSDYLLAVRAQAAGYAPVLTVDKRAAKTGTHQLLR